MLSRLNKSLYAVMLILGLLVFSSASPAQTMTQQQGDAILKELQQIRQLLEQMAKTNAMRPATNPAPPARVKVNIAHDFSMGRDDAPVTIVEFTDYQCPYCMRFHTTVFADLKKNFIDTGKVHFISRDLPLGIHANAMNAARAGRCAGDQGKYWELRDAMINNSKDLSPAAITKYAQGVGLDVGAFQACFESDKYKADIEKEVADANALGITGTPTFVIGKTTPGQIDGLKFVGALAYAFYEAKIKEALEPPAAVAVTK